MLAFFFSHLNTQRCKQKEMYDNRLHLELACQDAEDTGSVSCDFLFPSSL